VTLSIGIVTSVFTGFVLSRLITTYWLRAQKSRKIEVPI
jgi:preprotein translocase subunit SecD